MRKIFTLPLLLLYIHVHALDPNHFTITRISAPYFIVDGNSPATLTQAYVGFEVTNNSNSAVTYAGLKFTITSINTSVPGQNYSVVSPATGIVNIGTLAPGQSKTCYYYVAYPASTTPQATFNITLSDNTASSKTQSFLIRNRSSISANAGGTATQTISNQDLIGGVVVDDVTYVVGNVQNGDENDFQVAVSSQFDPTKITLLNTEVIASSVPGINVGTTDSIYFLSGNGSNGATVTIRWTFRITGYNFTTYLLPCAGATSGGSNYKYALNTSLGSGTPITVSSAANPLTITKISDHPVYGVNSPAVFTVTIQNPGLFGVTIDRITDELPAGFSFGALDPASQVTTSNSTAGPANGATGTISFEGSVASGGNTSYYIPAGGSLVLKYSATSSSSPASNLLTTVRFYIGVTEVGSVQATVSVSATLPVTLLSFKANRLNEKIKLDWVTTHEFNTHIYQVERSSENGTFNRLATISANRVSSINNYSYTDSLPLPGTHRYRLKMIDHDGRFSYSPVVSMTISKETGITMNKLYPNPVTEQTTISVSSAVEQEVNISITDIFGKNLLSFNKIVQRGDNEILLNQISGIPAGTYFLQMVSSFGIQVEKFVKTR